MKSNYGKIAFLVGFGFTVGQWLAKDFIHTTCKVNEYVVERIENEVIAKSPKDAEVYEKISGRKITNKTVNSFGFQLREEL